VVKGKDGDGGPEVRGRMEAGLRRRLEGCGVAV
jgi:hypothetical protein